MKVSQIFLDQQPMKKKNGKDIRVLETEAFKDPLSLQIHFDDEEKAYFDSKINEQNKILKEIEGVLDDLKTQRAFFEKYKITTEELMNEKDKLIEKLKKQSIMKTKEKNELNESVNRLQEGLTETDHNVESNTLAIEKIKKTIEMETYVFKGSDFFSSSGISFLGKYEIIAGKYLEIIQTKIKEKNEYCTNEDNITFNTLQLSNTYLPQYELTSQTKLDTPTATIDYTIVLIPIK